MTLVLTFKQNLFQRDNFQTSYYLTAGYSSQFNEDRIFDKPLKGIPFYSPKEIISGVMNDLAADSESSCHTLYEVVDRVLLSGIHKWIPAKCVREWRRRKRGRMQPWVIQNNPPSICLFHGIYLYCVMVVMESMADENIQSATMIREQPTSTLKQHRTLS